MKNKRFNYKPRYDKNNRSYFKKPENKNKFNLRIGMILIMLILLAYILINY